MAIKRNWIFVLVLGSNWMLNGIGLLAQTTQDDAERPLFQEMTRFCKRSLDEIENPPETKEVKAEKIETEPVTKEQVPRRIYDQELADLLKIAEEAKGKKKGEWKNDWQEIEYVQALIKFGLLDQAHETLKWLEGKLEDSKNREGLSAVINFYMATVKRALGQQEAAEQAFKAGERSLEQIKRKGKFKGSEIGNKLSEFKQSYEKRGMNWLRLGPKLQDYRSKCKNHPEVMENWKRLAEYAKDLDCRLEEIVALRILLDVFRQSDKEIADQLIKAYRDTDQSEKARLVKK